MRCLSCLLALLLLLASAVPGRASGEGRPGREDRVLEPAFPVSEEAEWLLETARAELGYREERGYTKYGEWAGDPRAEWCAEFLCWCVDQVDQAHGTSLLNTLWPLYGGTNTGRDWFITRGRYVCRWGYIDGWGYQWLRGEKSFVRPESYIPQPGDWVFFTWTTDRDTDHVALVEYCTEDFFGEITVHVIEGNNPDRVQRSSYPLTYNRVLGYGTVNDVTDVTMRYGCRGDKVAQLEDKLVYLGYLEESLAGELYGGGTLEAVRAFQRDMGLRVNGIANLETQRSLDEAVRLQQREDPSLWQVIEEDDE